MFLVKEAKGAKALTLKGLFAIAPSEPRRGVPRGPGHTWQFETTYEEFVVSVLYRPDMKTLPDFEAKGKA